MISQRVKNMMEDIDAHNKSSLSKSAALLLLSMLLFFIPVFTTFEAWDTDPEIKQEVSAVNSKNAFFIINENGTYDLYLDNNYVGTATEIFDSTIPIKERKPKMKYNKILLFTTAILLSISIAPSLNVFAKENVSDTLYQSQICVPFSENIK